MSWEFPSEMPKARMSERKKDKLLCVFHAAEKKKPKLQSYSYHGQCLLTALKLWATLEIGLRKYWRYLSSEYLSAAGRTYFASGRYFNLLSLQIAAIFFQEP